MVELESFNPVLLFICRLCRRTFRNTDTLKAHKLKIHEKDCESIKCIIFEERFLDQRWVPLNDTYTYTIQHVRNSNSDRNLDSDRGIGVGPSPQHVTNVCVAPSSPSPLPVPGGSPSSLSPKRPSPSKNLELNSSKIKSTDNHTCELRRRDERTMFLKTPISSLSKSAHVDIEANNYDSPLSNYQQTEVDGTSATGELDQVQISKGSESRSIKHNMLSGSEKPAVSPALTSPSSSTVASNCERYPAGTASLTSGCNFEEHSFPSEGCIVTKSVLRSSGVTVTFDLQLATTKPKPNSGLLKRNNTSRTFLSNLDVNRDINAGSGSGSGSGSGIDAEFNKAGSNSKLQANTEPDTGRIGTTSSSASNNIEETNHNKTGNIICKKTQTTTCADDNDNGIICNNANISALTPVQIADELEVKKLVAQPAPAKSESHVLVLPVPFPAPDFPQSKPVEHENPVFLMDYDYAFEEVVETSENIITDEDDKRISEILSRIGNNSGEEPVSSSSVNEILDVDLIEDVLALIYDASIEAESMGLLATADQDQQDQSVPLDLSVTANVKVSTTPDFTPNAPTHYQAVTSETSPYYVEHSPPPASVTTSSDGAGASAADTCITKNESVVQPRKQKSRKIAKLSQEDTIATITPAEPQRNKFSRISNASNINTEMLDSCRSAASHSQRISRNSGRTGRKRTSDRLKVSIENHKRRKLCRKVNETDATSKSNSDDSDGSSMVPVPDVELKVSPGAPTCEWKMKLRGSPAIFNKNKALNAKASDRRKSSSTKSSAKPQQNPSVEERVRKSPRTQKKVQGQSSIPRQSHYCKSCNRTFADSTQLKEHDLKFHSGPRFTCRDCKKVYSDKKCYKRHEKSHRMNLKHHVCQVEGCSASFFFKSHLAQHMEVHTQVKSFKCPSCPREFTRRRGLESHLVHHGMGASEFKCRYCVKAFSGKISLENHERTHTGDKPFKCKVSTCHLTFMSSYTREMHYRVKHFKELGLEQFQCTMCQKFRKYRAFGTQRLLDAHVLSQHSTVKPFNCSHPGCGKGYVQKRSLIDHEKSHTGENPYHPCVKCGKGFLSRSTLGRHRRRWIGGSCGI